jgi:hypothetical protein
MTDEPADDRQKAVDPPKSDLPFLEFTPEVLASIESSDPEALEDSDLEALRRALPGSAFSPEMMLAFIAGNFSSAFVQALGQRAADSAANLSKRKMKRMTRRLRPKRVEKEGQPDEYHIGLKGGATATIVVTTDTPDEARLALLDLDVTAPELRGRELHWNAAAGAWRPHEELPGPS